MLFNSFVFVWLALATFAIYYLKPLRNYQIPVLIVSSLIFYAYNNPWLLILLIASVAINVLTSYAVVYGNPKNRKFWAVTGVVINLALLAFFKYSPLISHSLFLPDSSIGEFLLQIPLPIGISFYTFEGISLLVDVFKEKYFKGSDVTPPSLFKHFNRSLFFISFFPHLIAGPILKAHQFYPQMDTVKYFKDIDWKGVFKLLIMGYFLKMVLADNLKDYTYWISYPYFQTFSTPALITMLFGYSCQIFSDFAGYSLIAIGLAKVFGYELLANFNFPYISTTFQDFWKRWHISLSSFLQEYLYIPLGGNKKGKVRTYLNLMITMFLGGLWHGAAWSYAVWGLFHGGALALERMVKPYFSLPDRFLFRWFKRLFVFGFVTLAWLLFKLPDFDQVLKYLQTMNAHWTMGMSVRELKICYGLMVFSIPVVIYHVMYLLRDHPVFNWYRKFEYVVYGLLLFLLVVNSGTSGSFIYFQF